MDLTEQNLIKVKEIRDKLIAEGTYQMPLRWEEVKRAIIYNNKEIQERYATKDNNNDDKGKISK